MRSENFGDRAKMAAGIIVLLTASATLLYYYYLRPGATRPTFNPRTNRDTNPESAVGNFDNEPSGSITIAPGVTIEPTNDRLVSNFSGNVYNTYTDPANLGRVCVAVEGYPETLIDAQMALGVNGQGIYVGVSNGTIYSSNAEGKLSTSFSGTDLYNFEGEGVVCASLQ